MNGPGRPAAYARRRILFMTSDVGRIFLAYFVLVYALLAPRRGPFGPYFPPVFPTSSEELGLRSDLE